MNLSGRMSNGYVTNNGIAKSPMAPSTPKTGLKWNPSASSLKFLADGYNKLKGVTQQKRRRTASVTIKQELGIISVTSYLVGGIIGPGIFISPAGILENTGSVGLSLIVWVASGLLATLAALCFAELGTSFPQSGSSYLYVKLAFGDCAAFVFEWVDVILRKSTTLCIRYLTFAVYLLQPLYPNCVIPTVQIVLIAAMAIIFVSVINAVGMKWRSGFQIVTTVAKCIALFTIMALGLYYLFTGHNENFRAPFEGSTMKLGNIAMSFSYGLYAYSGWDIMNCATEEIKNVNRTLPISIILSMVVVTLINFFTNVAYFAALSVDEVLDSDAVAVVFARKFVTVGAWLMSISVSISTIGSCNANLFQVSRYYFAIAREKQLPKFLATVHPKYNTPQPAIIVMTILILTCLASKDIKQLLAYYGLLKWSMVAYPIAAQIYLRYKYPHIKRPFKLPIILPILTCCILILLLIVPIQKNWFNSVVALLLSSICLPIYAFFFLWTNKPKFLQRFLTSIDDGLANFFQKLLLVEYTDEMKHIDCKTLLREETEEARRSCSKSGEEAKAGKIKSKSKQIRYRAI